MRQFIEPGGFDLGLSLYTSFGYFTQKEQDRQVLHNIGRSLKPRGVFVIDVLGKERLARTFLPATVTECGDGTLLVQRQQIGQQWTRLRNEWILVQGNRARRYQFEYTLYSGQELKDRLLEAGFCQVRRCGGFDGGEYSLHSPRLVVVATHS